MPTKVPTREEYARRVGFARAEIREALGFIDDALECRIPRIQEAVALAISGPLKRALCMLETGELL